jgi:hypothetical protein
MRKGSNATSKGLVGWVREAVCQGWQGANGERDIAVASGTNIDKYRLAIS